MAELNLVEQLRAKPPIPVQPGVLRMDFVPVDPTITSQQTAQVGRLPVVEVVPGQSRFTAGIIGPDTELAPIDPRVLAIGREGFAQLQASFGTATLEEARGFFDAGALERNVTVQVDAAEAFAANPFNLAQKIGDQSFRADTFGDIRAAAQRDRLIEIRESLPDPLRDFVRRFSSQDVLKANVGNLAQLTAEGEAIYDRIAGPQIEAFLAKEKEMSIQSFGGASDFGITNVLSGSGFTSNVPQVVFDVPIPEPAGGGGFLDTITGILSSIPGAIGKVVTAGGTIVQNVISDDNARQLIEAAITRDAPRVTVVNQGVASPAANPGTPAPSGGNSPGSTTQPNAGGVVGGMNDSPSVILLPGVNQVNAQERLQSDAGGSSSTNTRETLILGGQGQTPGETVVLQGQQDSGMGLFIALALGAVLLFGRD